MTLQIYQATYPQPTWVSSIDHLLTFTQKFSLQSPVISLFPVTASASVNKASGYPSAKFHPEYHLLTYLSGSTTCKWTLYHFYKWQRHFKSWCFTCCSVSSSSPIFQYIYNILFLWWWTINNVLLCYYVATICRWSAVKCTYKDFLQQYIEDKWFELSLIYIINKKCLEKQIKLVIYVQIKFYI